MEGLGCLGIAVASYRNPQVIACGQPVLILTAMEFLMDDDVEYIIVSGVDEPPAVIWSEDRGFIPEQYPYWLLSMLQHRYWSTGSPEAIAPFPTDGLEEDGNDDDDDDDDDDGDRPTPGEVVENLLSASVRCG